MIIVQKILFLNLTNNQKIGKKNPLKNAARIFKVGLTTSVMDSQNSKHQTVWNLDFIKSKELENSQELWDELESAYRNFISKWKDRKDYLENDQILREALDDYEELVRKYAYGGKLGYYYTLKSLQNQDDIEIKAANSKLEEKLKWLSNDIQFFGLNISRIPQEKQKELLQSPKLADYKHYLELSFSEAKHLLSDSEEKIMTLKSSSGRWVDMVERLLSRESRKIIDEDGEIKEKSFSETLSLISSTNKKSRDSAATALNDILEKISIIAEEEINAIFTNKKIDDQLRKYARADSATHLGDDIDTEVVDALRDAVTKNFDISKKFYEFKARLLGLERLEYHERNVPYGDVDKKYSYDESVELVSEVFKDLDEELYQIYSKFLSEGRFDVYPKKGKVDGAYCFHSTKSLPTFILLNHEGRLREVLTIAHETGHGINNELIRKKHNSLNFGTPVSTAECASTFMEDFVLQKLLKETSDDELRLAIMVMKLSDDVSTIFRQVACYNFEWELHQEIREKGYLSKEDIGKLFLKHMSSYMGEFVEQNKGSENWWVYWGHIRRFFYVYSYASGLLISKSMQSMVHKDKKAIHKVKEFLAAGTSDSPKNIFLKMGIDITNPRFWEEGIGEVRKLLEETQKLAKKLGRI
jgi:oligoendopeptidase F